MRAYLIGYRHGVIIDGYMADLINQGKCEAMQDESLDVEYVPIEQVLEIIDTENHIANTAGMTEAYQRGYQDALRFVRKKIEEKEKG